MPTKSDGRYTTVEDPRSPLPHKRARIRAALSISSFRIVSSTGAANPRFFEPIRRQYLSGFMQLSGTGGARGVYCLKRLSDGQGSLLVTVRSGSTGSVHETLPKRVLVYADGRLKLVSKSESSDRKSR